MRYLRKSDSPEKVSPEWTYPKDAVRIRSALIEEQRGFCAYSERFIRNTDSSDVEHFDPRLKNTASDGHKNWYAVLHWMNSHKPRKIEPYEPLLAPHSSDLTQRIKYEDGIFDTVDAGDQPARNLINYLGWNKLEVCKDRQKHINRIRSIRELFPGSNAEFVAFLREDLDNLSFATALESELGLEI
jgi:hypothetical protein